MQSSYLGEPLKLRDGRQMDQANGSQRQQKMRNNGHRLLQLRCLCLLESVQWVRHHVREMPISPFGENFPHSCGIEDEDLVYPFGIDAREVRRPLPPTPTRGEAFRVTTA